MAYSSELFKFAYFPNYEASINFLATNLADNEQWDYSGSGTKNNSILKNYLEFTYRKVVSENKVVYTAKNDFACFNTGLVTTNLEDIIAFFELNRLNFGAGVSPYVFKAFLKVSDIQILKHFASKIPETADYFQNPEDLIFNPKCDLISDIDHIIQDNIARFPAHLQSADNAELRRQLNGSIMEVKKKVRTNYKIAVPQYYTNRIQLLLPLCLTAGSPNPDLALAVSRINLETYSARTILTLQMAYSNARLIVKPQSSWLKP